MEVAERPQGQETDEPAAGQTIRTIEPAPDTEADRASLPTRRAPSAGGDVEQPREPETALESIAESDPVTEQPAAQPKRRFPWLRAIRVRRRPQSDELPVVSRAADLPHRRTARGSVALCFLFTFGIYLALIPQFLRYSNPPTGDQPYYLMDTITIIQDGDLNVRNNYENRDEDKFYALAPKPEDFVGISAPYPLPLQLAAATARPSEEWYGAHPPGLPILLIIPWVIGSWFSLWWPATIVFMCLVGALVIVNVFMLAHELTGRIWIAWAVWIPIAFSNPVLSYSFLLFTELSTGLLLIYAFRRIALGWGSNGWVRLLLVGLCLGYMPWLASRSVPIVAVLGLYALVQWWRYRRALKAHEGTPVFEKRNNGSLLSFAWFTVPVVIAGALMLWYNFFLYGKIASTHMDPGHGFNWPWQGLEKAREFVNASFGLLFDQQFGLLPYAPIYVLSLVGIIAMFRIRREADRRLLLWGALLMVPYMAVVAAFTGWTGIWSPPARYMTTFVPLLGAPLAMSLRVLSTSWLYRIVYVLLALPGIYFMALMMKNGHLLWVLERGALFKWMSSSPEAPLRLDLLPFLPAFQWHDPMKQPVLVGWMSTALLVVLIAGYVLVSRRRSMLRPRRLPIVAQGLLWSGTVAGIAGGWLLINFEDLKPKVVLVEQSRWQLNPPPVRAYGITALNNLIYVTGYGYQDRSGAESGGTVGVLNVNTGEYKLINPVAPGGAMAFSHPGDIKMGPDGMLYVLNNGPGTEALLAMTPDGQVQKGLQLDNKSTVAAAMSWGPDGFLYVADMVNGRVTKYSKDGGPPVASCGGENGGGLNNPSAVAVTAEGTIYANEGHGPIYQFDQECRIERKWVPKCQTLQMVVNGEWLDVTCDRYGLISIHRESGELKGGYFSNGAKPSFPTGLTYGPDGALYMLDGDKIIKYTIQH
jgi:hypothetical protein